MSLPPSMLLRLCPMHVLLDGAGRIVQAGPTLAKLRPEIPLQGALFFDVIEVARPRAITCMRELLATSGRKLHLHLRDVRRTPLKGHVVPDGDHGAVVDLSFGISVAEAVREFDLTSRDFSPTDLTIEMLYLVEAKSAAMEASRTLNMRLQGAMIAAEERAFTDTLTGLKNRRACDHVLDRLTRGGKTFALMHVDLDYFKEVNDTMGHAAGDHVLQEVARIMVEETRKDDTVARIGGDEFVLILDALLDRRVLSDIAGRLVSRIERPIKYEGRSCNVSASIGISVTGDRYRSPSELLEQADVALYASKRAGRAQFRFYDPSMTDTTA